MTASAAIAALEKLKGTLRRLAELPRRTAAEAAPGITRLLQRQFAQGVDPYGHTWAALRPSTLRKHGPPPLTDTRKLRAGTKAMVARASYAGLRIVVGAPYGAFAQLGFRAGKRRVPPRRILPDRGIPAAWKRALDNAARRASRAAAEGR